MFLVRYCLDINCNIKDDGILPKKLCQSCLEKLQTAFEFKNKSKESEKYLNEILLSNTTEVDTEEPEITPYNPAPAYFAPDDEDDLLQPVDDRASNALEYSSDKKVKPKPRGQRCGDFRCSVCDKSFRYVKAFNTHVKQHKKGEISRGGFKRRYILKKKKLEPEIQTVAYEEQGEEGEEDAEGEQAPYDSLSPYGSPAHYEPPAREDSPDFGMMMLNNFHNGANGSAEQHPPVKKMRMRKQKLPSRSPSRSPSPEIVTPAKRPSLAPSTSSSGPRGRGRPRKDQINKPEQPEVDEEPEASPFADFHEVDVSSMLKKSILDADSYSQSGPSTARSRSRSSSVELIDDFDIFGSVLPDNNRIAPKPATSGGFGSGTTFPCGISGCSHKFHLRANLKKHQREVHGTN
jgi:C2H2-type zinc finger